MLSVKLQNQAQTAPIHPATATMKANYYDQNSRPQLSDVVYSRRFLGEMVQRIVVPEDEPVVVADFGCGHGGSSGQLMQFATSRLRQRDPQRPVMVFRNDLPSSDFSSLAVDSVSVPEHGTCEFLAPGSFYSRIFPANFIHLATCFAALHWMQRVPQVVVSKHLTHEAGYQAARHAFASEWQKGWRDFLAARFVELRPGGSMLLSIVGRFEQDSVHGPFELLQRAAASLVEDGHPRPQHLERFLLPIYRPTESEVAQPFATSERFRALEVELCDVTEPECPFFAQLSASGDVATYARGYSSFIRAFSESAIRYGLFEFQQGQVSAVPLLDCFYERVRRLIIAEPEPEPERFAMKRTRIVVVLRKTRT